MFEEKLHHIYRGAGNSPRNESATKMLYGKFSQMSISIIECFIIEANNRMSDNIYIGLNMEEITNIMQNRFGYKSKTYYDIINAMVDRDLLNVTIRIATNGKKSCREYKLNPTIINLTTLGLFNKLIPEIEW